LGGIEDFEPERLAHLSTPFYVRKLSRPRHWNGEEGADENTRIQTILDEVFRPEKGLVSLFRVENATDFVRILSGLNSLRSSLREQLFILCITRNELDRSGVNVAPSPGETLCDHANRCHFDLAHSRDALEGLVRRLVHSDRQCCRITKPLMQTAANYAESIGCRATYSSLPACTCNGEPSL